MVSKKRRYKIQIIKFYISNIAKFEMIDISSFVAVCCSFIAAYCRKLQGGGFRIDGSKPLRYVQLGENLRIYPKVWAPVD